MFRSALFGAAALVAGAFATPTFCATVDLSPVVAAEPALAAQGNQVPLTPIANGAAAIGNAALSAASTAEGVAVNPFGGATPLDAGGLGDARGGTDVNLVGAVSEQDLTAVNTGNGITAGSVVNGPVTVGSNAFSGFNGIGNFLMNTGNQNNIQGTLSVNVVIAAPAAAH